MKIKYIFDSENEDDMLLYERVKQVNAIHRAISDFKEYLRTNTKHYDERSGLNLDTMESVRDEFYRTVQDNNVNLEL